MYKQVGRGRGQVRGRGPERGWDSETQEGSRKKQAGGGAEGEGAGPEAARRSLIKLEFRTGHARWASGRGGVRGAGYRAQVQASGGVRGRTGCGALAQPSEGGAWGILGGALRGQGVECWGVACGALGGAVEGRGREI